ncbi:MAG: DUF3575 domain-containing protein [Alistipes senegalensis]|nr:DUF3575 domain-containing protein [Bacteroides cellulosilyticus]MCM1352959.1 DUF3575 domain-containing protein [Alistipes senegalensis]
MRKLVILLLCVLAAHTASAQIFAVRADALAALTGTLHLGTEAAVTDRWSVEVSGYWNPIDTPKRSLNFAAVQVGGRYWLYEAFVGHFIGSHLSYVDYDLGNRTRRYDGWAFGIGFSYGYSWMLAKRWNVSVEAGIGLFHTKDTRRDPTVGDWYDEYVYRNRRWTLAPSRLEVSFSYLF